MKDLGILKIIIPELVDAVGFNQYNPHHDKNVFEHILCVVNNTPPILEIRLAALFHDIGKPHTLTIDEKGVGHFYGHDKVGVDIAKNILSRLKFSNELIKDITILMKEHKTNHNKYKDKGLKRLINRVGKENIFNLIELQKADKICSSNDINIDFLFQREKEIKRILESKEPYEKKHLAIDGHDIINLGYIQGELI